MTLRAHRWTIIENHPRVQMLTATKVQKKPEQRRTQRRFHRGKARLDTQLHQRCPGDPKYGTGLISEDAHKALPRGGVAEDFFVLGTSCVWREYQGCHGDRGRPLQALGILHVTAQTTVQARGTRQPPTPSDRQEVCWGE